MTLYTVVSRHGEATQHGLTMGQAADAVMTYDGRRWDICAEYMSGQESFPSLTLALRYQAEQIGVSDPEDRDAVREEYEPTLDCWRLYTSRFSENSPHGASLTPSLIFSLADNLDSARDEIFAQVLDRADMWSGQEVMTDSEWICGPGGLPFDETPQGEAFIASAMERETDPKIMEAIAFFSRDLSEAESLWNGEGFGTICHLSDFWEHVTDNGRTEPTDYAWGVEGAAWWRAISGEESA